MAQVEENGQPLPQLTMEETKFLKKRMQTSTIRTGIQAIFHPMHFSKVLIQIGHEPCALSRAKLYGFFGPDCYCLPNGLVYCREIGKKHGYGVLWRGVGAAFSSGLCGAVGTSLGFIAVDRKAPQLKVKAGGPQDAQAAAKEAGRIALREALAKTVGAVVASPLRVIAIRQIASFIGDEVEYATIGSSIRHIHQNEGLAGFFKGLVPLLIVEWGSTWLTHGISFVIDRAYIRLTEKELPEEMEEELDNPEDAAGNLSKLTEGMEGAGGIRRGLKFAVPFVVNGAMYRYVLVSTLMTVNACGLAAGALPYAPTFGVWQDCYEHLKNVRGIGRGAKLFFRQYLGPLSFRNGKTFASL